MERKMPLPLAIVALMKETVTVKTVSGTDAYGNKVLSAGTTMKAYVSFARTLMRDLGGDQFVSSTQVYLAKDVPALTAEGQVTLPDGRTPPIKSVNRPAWPSGERHVVVYF